MPLCTPAVDKEAAFRKGRCCGNDKALLKHDCKLASSLLECDDDDSCKDLGGCTEGDASHPSNHALWWGMISVGSRQTCGTICEEFMGSEDLAGRPGRRKVGLE